MSANMNNNENLNGEQTNVPTYKVFNNFDEMNLKDELTRGIYNYGYERPSEIQCRGIGPIVEGNDVIGQAQSGMGKTGTYSIGTLQVINHKINDTQAIILANTRELATQVESVINNLGKYMKTFLFLNTLYYGTDFGQKSSQLVLFSPIFVIL